MWLSGALIYLFPSVFPVESIWFAMPVTEVVTAFLVILFLIRCQRRVLLGNDKMNLRQPDKT